MSTPAPSATTSPAKSAASARPGVEELASQIQEISSLPTVALRVMEIAGDPHAGASDLKAAVEADPALCVRMLRCVNSAAFSLRREVSDVGQAIAFLGFSRVRDLAVTATVSDLFRSSTPVATYDRGGLWKHLAATAICSRMIAVRTRIQGFEDAFLAGLLHDVGIILLDQHHHDPFKQVILSLTSHSTLCEVEQKFYGWNHAEFGARVGTQWRLPRTAISAVQFHHEPDQCLGADAPIVHCVSLANLVVTLKGYTSVGMSLVGLCDASLDVLGITKNDLKVFATDLDREMDVNKHLIEIQKG